MHLLGYSSNQKRYKCYSPVTKKFYNSIDVTFFQDQSYYHKSDIKGENPITRNIIFGIAQSLLQLFPL